MRFNLSQIHTFLNKEIKDGLEIEIFLDCDSLLAKTGEVTCYFNHEFLQKTLIKNDIDISSENITGKQVSELISKFIINELMASIGKKVYPNVK